MLLLALACAGGQDPEALHADALRRLEDAPAEAAALCPRISDEALRSDCAWAVVERLGPEQVEVAEGLCGALEAGAAAECWFRYAEASQSPEVCGRAGAHELDCRMHLLTRDLGSWMPPKAVPGGFEEVALAHVEAVGFSGDDPRPWSALYRWVLGRQRPLDRGACAAAPDPTRREACAATALAHYDDLLNHLRDRGEALCEGELPPAARYTPDPELDALLARRRAADLCDPSARRPPPPPGPLPGAGR
ncbi:MAG: hypothetical protein H6741_34600 [Alphaproteobacteria bacterium]|nr:hypothetical protein [Alphaproteobacteria bacterium]